jgi:hypothetical protein
LDGARRFSDAGRLLGGIRYKLERNFTHTRADQKIVDAILSLGNI